MDFISIGDSSNCVCNKLFGLKTYKEKLDISLYKFGLCAMPDSSVFTQYTAHLFVRWTAYDPARGLVSVLSVESQVECHAVLLCVGGCQ